ncbi:hypothetical protein SeMB42_g05909 [Synchytrium endobioticum]|uniref:Exocyst complex component EXOC2/Sec5 N-terminal domain-containing protein n=1 Tax=Synchytrium endobioticum TaxID=286115 RepID=A0A507CNF3_9FUNG|nr:hypothetical protein SeMB42_g05909 [Synchytrium endobioticum]
MSSDGREKAAGKSGAIHVKEQTKAFDDDQDQGEEEEEEEEAEQEEYDGHQNLSWTTEEKQAVLQHYAIDTLFPTEWDEDKDTPMIQPDEFAVTGLTTTMSGKSTQLSRSSLASASAIADTGIVDGADPLHIKSSTKKISKKKSAKRSSSKPPTEHEPPHVSITSRSFAPDRFLLEVHGDTPYKDLVQGLETVKSAMEKREELMKNLVKTHFSKFVTAKESIDAFYDEIRAKTLISHDSYGVKPFSSRLNRTHSDASSLYTPMLERRTKAENIRVALGILEQWKFFFNLPSTLADFAQKSKYDAVAQNYKKGKYLMESSFGSSMAASPARREAVVGQDSTLLPSSYEPVFEKVWTEVEKIVVKCREDLMRLLSNPSLPIEQQERTIGYLMDLDSQEDPVWFYLQNKHQWILSLLTDAYEDYCGRLNELRDLAGPVSPGVLTTATSARNAPKTSVEVHKTIVRSDRFDLSDFKRAISSVQTRDFESEFAHDLDAQLWKATLKLAKALSIALVKHLPSFWKVSRLFSASRSQKLNNQATRKRRGATDARQSEVVMQMIHSILGTYAHIFANALFLHHDVATLEQKVASGEILDPTVPTFDIRPASREEILQPLSDVNLSNTNVNQSNTSLTAKTEKAPSPLLSDTRVVSAPLTPKELSIGFARLLWSHPITASFYLVGIMAELTECRQQVSKMQMTSEAGFLGDLDVVVENVQTRAMECICSGVIRECKSFYLYEDWLLEPEARQPISEETVRSTDAVGVLGDTTSLPKLFYRLFKFILRALYRIASANQQSATRSPSKVHGLPFGYFGANHINAASTNAGRSEDESVNQSIVSATEMYRVRTCMIECVQAFLDVCEWLAVMWKPQGNAEMGEAKYAMLKGGEYVMVGGGEGVVLTHEFAGRKARLLDVANLDTRLLIVISNLSYLKLIALPKLVVLFESKFRAPLTSDVADLQKVIDHLDSILFQNYIRRKHIHVAEMVEQGVVASGLDWYYIFKPEVIRQHVHDILLMFVLVHAEVSAVGKPIMDRVLRELMSCLANDLLLAYRSIDRFSPGGMMQATLETEFLQQTLTKYETLEISVIFQLIYDSIERGVPSAELEFYRQSTRVQEVVEEVLPIAILLSHDMTSSRYSHLLVATMPVPMQVDQQAAEHSSPQMSIETACSIASNRNSPPESTRQALDTIARQLACTPVNPILNTLPLNALIPYLSQEDTVDSAILAVKAYIKLKSFEELTTSFSNLVITGLKSPNAAVLDLSLIALQQPITSGAAKITPASVIQFIDPLLSCLNHLNDAISSAATKVLLDFCQSSPSEPDSDNIVRTILSSRALADMIQQDKDLTVQFRGFTLLIQMGSIRRNSFTLVIASGLLDGISGWLSRDDDILDYGLIISTQQIATEIEGGVAFSKLALDKCLYWLEMSDTDRLIKSASLKLWGRIAGIRISDLIGMPTFDRYITALQTILNAQEAPSQLFDTAIVCAGNTGSTPVGLSKLIDASIPLIVGSSYTGSTTARRALILESMAMWLRVSKDADHFYRHGPAVKNVIADARSPDDDLALAAYSYLASMSLRPWGIEQFKSSLIVLDKAGNARRVLGGTFWVDLEEYYRNGPYCIPREARVLPGFSLDPIRFITIMTAAGAAPLQLLANLYFAEDHRTFSVIPPIQVQAINERKRILVGNLASSSTVKDLRQTVSDLYRTFATEEREGEVDSLSDVDTADIDDKSTRILSASVRLADDTLLFPQYVLSSVFQDKDDVHLVVSTRKQDQSRKRSVSSITDQQSQQPEAKRQRMTARIPSPPLSNEHTPQPSPGRVSSRDSTVLLSDALQQQQQQSEFESPPNLVEQQPACDSVKVMKSNVIGMVSICASGSFNHIQDATASPTPSPVMNPVAANHQIPKPADNDAVMKDVHTVYYNDRSKKLEEFENDMKAEETVQMNQTDEEAEADADDEKEDESEDDDDDDNKALGDEDSEKDIENSHPAKQMNLIDDEAEETSDERTEPDEDGNELYPGNAKKRKSVLESENSEVEAESPYHSEEATSQRAALAAMCAISDDDSAPTQSIRVEVMPSLSPTQADVKSVSSNPKTCIPDGNKMGTDKDDDDASDTELAPQVSLVRPQPLTETPLVNEQNDEEDEDEEETSDDDMGLAPTRSPHQTPPAPVNDNNDVEDEDEEETSEDGKKEVPSQDAAVSSQSLAKPATDEEEDEEETSEDEEEVAQPRAKPEPGNVEEDKTDVESGEDEEEGIQPQAIPASSQTQTKPAAANDKEDNESSDDEKEGNPAVFQRPVTSQQFSQEALVPQLGAEKKTGNLTLPKAASRRASSLKELVEKPVTPKPIAPLSRFVETTKLYFMNSDESDSDGTDSSDDSENEDNIKTRLRGKSKSRGGEKQKRRKSALESLAAYRAKKRVG